MLLDNRCGISRLIGHLGHVFVDGNARRNASVPQRVLLPLDASVLGDLLLEPVKEAVAIFEPAKLDRHVFRRADGGILPHDVGQESGPACGSAQIGILTANHLEA